MCVNCLRDNLVTCSHEINKDEVYGKLHDNSSVKSFWMIMGCTLGFLFGAYSVDPHGGWLQIGVAGVVSAGFGGVGTLIGWVGYVVMR
jgi:hypothetical protein